MEWGSKLKERWEQASEAQRSYVSYSVKIKLGTTETGDGKSRSHVGGSEAVVM